MDHETNHAVESGLLPDVERELGPLKNLIRAALAAKHCLRSVLASRVGISDELLRDCVAQLEGALEYYGEKTP